MMRSFLYKLKTIYRFLGLIAIISWMNLSIQTIMLLTLPFKQMRKCIRLRMQKFLASSILNFLRCRLTIEGEEPKGPYLLVMNHLSYIDIFVVFKALNASMISKKEVQKWPFVGNVSKQLNTIFLDRNNKRDLLRINQIMEKRLQSGDSIIFFPEGTSSDGTTIQDFKPSLFHYPAQKGVPVYYATLSYRAPKGKHASESICWWGDMELFPHLTSLIHMPYFEAKLTLSSTPVVHENRKELCKNLEIKIRKLYKQSKLI